MVVEPDFRMQISLLESVLGPTPVNVTSMPAVWQAGCSHAGGVEQAEVENGLVASRNTTDTGRWQWSLGDSPSPVGFLFCRSELAPLRVKKSHGPVPLDQFRWGNPCCSASIRGLSS